MPLAEDAPSEGVPLGASPGMERPHSEDPHAQAQREVADAEKLRRQWEHLALPGGPRAACTPPFAITVQPVVGGMQAAIDRVTAL